MKWFYAKDGQQIGPVEFSEIQRLLAEGQLTADSLVWEQGAPNWVKLSTVLSGGPSAAPSSPQVYQQGVPAKTTGAQGLPDYGDIVSWGFIGVLVPCLSLLVLIALIVLNCMEYFASRKEVEAGRLQASDYSRMNPVLFLLGLICCGGLPYPLFMHFRNKSGYFKPQPHAVTIAIVVVILNIIISGITGYFQYAKAAADMAG